MKRSAQSSEGMVVITLVIEVGALRIDCARVRVRSILTIIEKARVTTAVETEGSSVLVARVTCTVRVRNT